MFKATKSSKSFPSGIALQNVLSLLVIRLTSAPFWFSAALIVSVSCEYKCEFGDLRSLRSNTLSGQNVNEVFVSFLSAHL